MLVSELSKKDDPSLKPQLQEKKQRRKKMDISALLDKQLEIASNIFNLTIGELIQEELRRDEEKQALRKQILRLREKIHEYELEKKEQKA